MKNIKRKISVICSRAALKRYEVLNRVKDRKESGFSTFVIMVFLVLIGVGLCILFREQIEAFVTKVMGKLDGAADAAF